MTSRQQSLGSKGDLASARRNLGSSRAGCRFAVPAKNKTGVIPRGSGITVHARRPTMHAQLKFGRTSSCFAVLTILTIVLTFPVLAAGQVERIDATARGTSTQMGRIISIKLIISKFSTPEDRQVLVDAFKK